MKLTTHLYQIPKLKMHGAMLPLLHHADMGTFTIVYSSVKPTSGIVHKIFLFPHSLSSVVQNATACTKLLLTKDSREQSPSTVRSEKGIAGNNTEGY
jgi:hypothetical protein